MEVRRLSEEVALLKDMNQTDPSSKEGGPHVKVPELAPFNGVRNSKTLEKFLLDADQYFKAAKILEIKQVPLIGMHLTGFT